MEILIFDFHIIQTRYPQFGAPCWKSSSETIHQALKALNLFLNIPVKYCELQYLYHC